MIFAAGAHEIIPIAIIPIAVERTLDSLIGGLVLSGAAWTWLRVARRQNSASRFIILFILLIGIAVLPIAGVWWMAAGTASSGGARSLVTLPVNAAEYLFLAWAVVAVAGLLRIGIGFLQLRRLKQSCAEVDIAALDEKVRGALADSPRAAVLCTSERVSVPTALGFAQPARIAIPAWLMDQLSPDELHHLVLHELAHLRRWDDWSNLAQRVLGALLFFHPAVWWLERRLSLEREMACDERVLAETGNARAYAKSLATMAERSFVRRTVALAQAAVSRLHDTTLRVSKILTPTSSRKPRMPLLASAAVAGGLTLAMAFFSPDLISFATPLETAHLAAARPAPAIKAAAPSDFETRAAKQILASMPLRRTVRPALRPASPKQADATIASADRDICPANGTNGNKLGGARVIPAKATLAKKHDDNVTRPAVLIFWQETYDDGAGNVIQRSFWRLVVLPIVSKEQPKRV